MKNILFLIHREFTIFFKNLGFNLFFYFLFPLLTYLFIVILFSNLFELNTFKTNAPHMNYSYYAFSSILFVCTAMISFISPILLIIRDNSYLDYMYTSKLNYLHYFGSVIISVFIFSYIEFIISLFISNQLIDSVLIYWDQIFHFLIVIFPTIFFFLMLGLLLSNFVKNYQTLLLVSIILFLLLAFGSFTFIPIYYFSDTLNYVSFTKTYNIIFQLYDMLISILENKTLGLQTFIISIFLSIIFYGLHLFIYYKKRKLNK